MRKEKNDVNVKSDEEIIEDYFSNIEVENINNLPAIEDIYGDLQELGVENEFSNMMADGIFLHIQDGTVVELSSTERRCVLHPVRGLEGMEVYKIDDDLYVCGECLTWLKPAPTEICNNYMDGDSCLFPRNWTDNGIKAWLEKNK